MRTAAVPVVGIAVGVAVGALTAVAQGSLGDGLGSLANSAGPWSVAAFVVARAGRRPAIGALAATVVLVGCEVGYVLATELRGDANAPSTVVFWLTAALLAGPPLGIAGAWSTTGGARRAAGLGALAGVLVGEGLYGLTVVAATTNRVYWAVEVGVGLAVAVAAVSGRPRRERLLGVATAVAAAAVVHGAGRFA